MSERNESRCCRTCRTTDLKRNSEERAVCSDRYYQKEA